MTMNLSLLAENGHICFTTSVEELLLIRMGMVYTKPSTTWSKLSSHEIETHKVRDLLQVSGMVKAYGISSDLVFNWEQTVSI